MGTRSRVATTTEKISEKTNLVPDSPLERDTTITVKFESNSTNAWGCKLENINQWAHWKVIHIASEKQASRLGVRVNDYIVAINGLKVDDSNYFKLGKLLRNGNACSVTFSRKKISEEQLENDESDDSLFGDDEEQEVISIPKELKE